MKIKTLDDLNMKTRDEAVQFLKSLWAETPNPCPLCGGVLDYMHKKAKKSNNRWQCTSCHQNFNAIEILAALSNI